jgi:hypothetical protein
MNWFLTRVYAETAGTAPVEEVSMGSYLLSMLLPVAIISHYSTERKGFVHELCFLLPDLPLSDVFLFPF